MSIQPDDIPRYLSESGILHIATLEVVCQLCPAISKLFSGSFIVLDITLFTFPLKIRLVVTFSGEVL